jgi:hypothetical protein
VERLLRGLALAALGALDYLVLKILSVHPERIGTAVIDNHFRKFRNVRVHFGISYAAFLAAFVVVN